MESKEEAVGRMRMQADLGRTSLGRDLGKGMVEMTMSAVVGLEDGREEASSLADCRGCGFLSSANDFSNGCPNCGCRDFDLSDATGA